MRLGVGRPADRDADLAEHVLSAIPDDMSDVVIGLVARAADAVERIVAEGIDVAMREFNGAA